ncbi:NUDIX hydrolase [Candidatus Woesearchaeota archaeon]|nr:NUDIX hydrolase [Candidatus Woesearchaeota archaeon]
MVHLHTMVAEYAIIVDEDKAQVLLVEWGDEYNHSWHFPGGRLEEDDREIEGLRREVREELNVEIEDIRPVFSKFVTKKDCKYVREGTHRYALFYLAKIKPGQEIKLNEDELYSYKWFRREDLGKLEFFMEFYKDMLEKVLPF